MAGYSSNYSHSQVDYRKVQQLQDIWRCLQSRDTRTHIIRSLPEEYGDVNLYGIIFSFTFHLLPLPQWLGRYCGKANTALLFYAIQQLPLSKNQKAIICWTAYIELITAQLVQQFNISVAAFILLAFAFIEKKKDFWAAFVILLGTFVKIYSIVGLAFFFFSKHKIKFLLSCLFWTILLFIFPIPFFGLEYTMSQYQDWFIAITEKNSHNMFAISQNVSLLGLVRRVSGNPDYSDLWLIVPGLFIFYSISAYQAIQKSLFPLPATSQCTAFHSLVQFRKRG